MFFNLLKRDTQTNARAGILNTDHGPIETPIFMPVGTAGTVKAVHQRELRDDIKAQIILGNTYHVYLRPGLETVERAGGIHRFTGWSLPMLTDSGGYQVYSLSKIRNISEEGATFKSHIDGSKHFFSPEYAIQVQKVIGADIIMAFDECTPYPCEFTYAKKSMEMTHRWLARCCKQFDSTPQLRDYRQVLFPIVQGSVYKDLRKISAEIISSYEKEGNAIGGLSVGEPAEDMYEMTEMVCAILPENKPRYLMGVGTPANLLESIALGIDMFDCVMPTRNARNGMIFTSEGIINIKNLKWKFDFTPIDERVGGFVNEQYTKSYLRHLFISGEMLGSQIASIQNLTFYLWLVKQCRQQILEGTFAGWKNQMVEKVMRRL